MSCNTFLLSIALALVVAGGVVLAVTYKSEIDRTRASARSGGRIVQTSAGPIEYAETGSGMPLLSIPGSGGGYDQGLAIDRASCAIVPGCRFRSHPGYRLWPQ